MIVSGGRNRSAKKILVFINSLDNRGQEAEELRALMRTVSRLQQVITGVGEHGPVVVFTAAVDTFKGLFRQKADKIMPESDLFHHFHGDLIMVTGNTGDRINRGHLMLGRGCFVVLGFGKDTQLPEFLIQVSHESLHPGLNGAEEMVTELLALRRLRAEKRTAGKYQVAAAIEKIPVYKEIFLLRSDSGRNAGSVHPAEKMKNTNRLPVQGLHGTQERRFFVQRFTAIGTIGSRDTEDMILDESIGGWIPGSVAARFEGGAKAAVGKGRSVGFSADQFLSGKLLDYGASGQR